MRSSFTSITDEKLKFNIPRTPVGITLELGFKRAK